MDEGFEIPVIFKGEELSFPASLVTTGYTYKIQVEIFGKIISFEPDEERNFRAVMAVDALQDPGKIDKGLLEEIAKTIEIFVK